MRKLVVPILLIVLAGCGGGSGGGGAAVNQVANGKSASITAAQGAMLYFGSNASQAGSPQVVTSTHASNLVPFYRQLASLVERSFRAQVNTWTPDGSTGLYYEIGSQTATTAQVLFSTDGISNNAGYVNAVLISGGNGNYPESVRLSLDLLIPNDPITGTITLTAYNSSGTNVNIQASVSSPTSGASVNMNLTDNNNQVTGSFSASKGSTSVAFNNIVATASSFTASFSVDSVTGNLSLSSNGSGSVQAVDTSGTWILSWDSSLQATLTAPNGQVTTGTLTSL